MPSAKFGANAAWWGIMILAMNFNEPLAATAPLPDAPLTSTDESKQHRQALGRDEAYHKKEDPAQWSHRGFQVEKMLAGNQPFDAIQNNVAPR